jgi:hypothetical protein
MSVLMVYNRRGLGWRQDWTKPWIIRRSLNDRANPCWTLLNESTVLLHSAPNPLHMANRTHATHKFTSNANSHRFR